MPLLELPALQTLVLDWSFLRCISLPSFARLKDVHILASVDKQSQVPGMAGALKFAPKTAAAIWLALNRVEVLGSLRNTSVLQSLVDLDIEFWSTEDMLHGQKRKWDKVLDDHVENVNSAADSRLLPTSQKACQGQRQSPQSLFSSQQSTMLAVPPPSDLAPLPTPPPPAFPTPSLSHQVTQSCPLFLGDDNNNDNVLPL
ncbi:hypothetical protein IE81DRAFT_349739 [Ceraceosorus guamensis]|uniref:Uncharacterized protein n=1 Tax=Ceraceosorus guamensis TaxID=1522189 RepID=A0A316VQN7_9BASI|nr:hypothetical protein IE81DRAFT_349739 [Ceraceosorus guamensis]PWN39917.1 hypothetical protein IE81DRAFT_349739 [Ceraceosorus guamensis]